jgi:RimJ/RimL family protein N-acetyltransferase
VGRRGGLHPRPAGGRGVPGRLLLVTDPRLTRHGIATEFGRALLDWAWGPLELDEVGACVDPARADYPRVLQKLGFWHTEDQERDGRRVAVYRMPRPKV